MKIMFIPPMLLQYAKNNEPFDDTSIFAELKWDGIRLIVSNMDELNLYTKNTNATAKYPELTQSTNPERNYSRW
jgi:DNA ligase-1